MDRYQAASFASEMAANNAATAAYVKKLQKKAAVTHTPTREGGGMKWFDPYVAELPEDDFRVFCGDLGNEVTDEMLHHAFSKYPSLIKVGLF